jgi:hypothetical protein
MLISKQQYYQGGESVCRNTSLQQMFMMIGSAEKAGSGVDKILKGWEALNWKRPYPIEKTQPNKVELVMPLESLLDEKVLAELDRLFGKRMKAVDSNVRIVLSMALTEEVINNERLREALAMHPADITHLLQHLCQEGFLASSGRGRGTVYRLKVTTLQDKVTTLQDKDTTLHAKNIALQDKDTTLHACCVHSTKMSREKLQELILEYCIEWRSAEEIATYVHRSKQYIRGEILPSMDQLLIRKYPLKEKHPGQEYKVRER